MEKNKNYFQEYLITMAVVAVVMGVFFPNEWVNAADNLAQLFQAW